MDRQTRKNAEAVRSGEEWAAEQRKAGNRFRSSRFIPTSDDWSPCHYINEQGQPFNIDWNARQSDDWRSYAMVEGTVMCHPPSGISRVGKRHPEDTQWFVRTCFWGNDDTGIERDLYFETREEAVEQYHRWVGWLNKIVVIQKYELLKLGFWHA